MNMTLENDTVDWDDLCTVESFDKGSPIEGNLSENIELIGVGNNAIPSRPTVTTPISLLVQSLVKQLCYYMEKDSVKASSLYEYICKKLYQMQLLDETYSKSEFEEMRSQYQMALNQLVNVTSDSELPFKFQTSWPIESISQSLWSRYCKDFEEICFIAGGGFGKVYKARNFLDKVQYAIKKIHIRAKDINSVSKHFDEVKTFASLTHPNIVPYKAAWLEPFFKNEMNKIQQIDEGSVNNNSDSNFDESDMSNYLSRNDSGDLEIVFESTESSCRYLEKNRNYSQYSTETMEECRAICKLSRNSNMNHFGTVDLQWATLYIQMEFCDKTLRTWLDNRNNNFKSAHTIHDILDIETSISILTQLVKGINYIHNLKIVHHDLKPTNIFVSGEEYDNLNIKVGDFGLACPLQRAYHIPASGTCMYAAPEQLDGQCHVKNDLYSIGLILLELIQLLGTEMEKVKTFELLRKGHVPANVTANHPKLAHIISKLVENNIEKRLDSQDLLYMLRKLKENKDDIIVALQKQVSLKDEIIQAKDEEIERLKRLLNCDLNISD